MSEQKHQQGAPGVWKKPNFGLIVVLSAAFILIMLIVAYFFARRGTADVNPRLHQSSNTHFLGVSL